MPKSFYAGAAFWACVAGALFCLRPKSRLHAPTMEAPLDRRRLAAALTVMLAVILLCTLPMSLSQYHTGEFWDFLKEYENFTESLLHGHLYFDYEPDPRLLAMENPYDYLARYEQEIPFHWDHALYNGHYYMYFGVVPVFLLFLPFRLLTGTSLASYHATQIFAAGYICGVFTLFHLLCRRFFRSMSFSVYLALSAALSVLSVWYCTAAPLLYCTAISAAMCMEIWSLYCFMRAVFVEDGGRSVRWAFFGSLFGALAFGCRPPVALANLLVLPLLAEYLRTPPRKRFRDLALAAAPYFVIGALLMLYNWLRFDSPFEFGQTYQLTVTDQSGYGLSGRTVNWLEVLNTILRELFYPTQFSLLFPYASLQSFFGNFPILLFSLWGLLSHDIRTVLKRSRLWPFYLTAMLTSLLMLTADIIYSPAFLERYRTDIYWLLALAAFIAFGCQFVKLAEAPAGRTRTGWSALVCTGSLLTVLSACLFFLVPHDNNLTMTYPEVLTKIESVLKLARR